MHLTIVDRNIDRSRIDRKAASGVNFLIPLLDQLRLQLLAGDVRQLYPTTDRASDLMRASL